MNNMSQSFDHRTYTPKVGDIVYNARGQFRKVLRVERRPSEEGHSPRVYVIFVQSFLKTGKLGKLEEAEGVKKFRSWAEDGRLERDELA